jgi:YVTN family beta-propeller protein
MSRLTPIKAMRFIKKSVSSVACTIVVACGVAVAPGLAAAASPSHEIYATNEISGDLSIINGDTLKVEATVPLGKRPRGIVASKDGKHLFVALSGSPIQGPPPPGGKRDGQDDDDDDDKPPADKAADGIGQFDIATRTLARVIRGVSDPEKLDVTPDGKHIYVASEDTGTAVVFDTASGKPVASANVGAEPEGVRVTPNGKFAYMTSESAWQVSIIDTKTNQIVKQIKVGLRPRAIAFTPDSKKAYVPGEFDGSITVIDAQKLTVLKTIQLDDKSARPMDAVVSPDGRSLYLSTGRGRTVVHIDTRIDKVMRSVQVGARPWGLAISPDGKHIYAANGPSNDVSVIDAASFKVIATIAVGKGPWGVAVARPAVRH